MQQTETYQLNLIETSDHFSPAPLNENAQKVEAALAGLQSGKTSAADTTALAARVTTLEGKKIAVGCYAGNGQTPRDIQLPFAPSALLFYMRGSGGAYIITPEYPMVTSDGSAIGTLNGSVLRVIYNVAFSMNSSGRSYIYVAFPK